MRRGYGKKKLLSVAKEQESNCIHNGLLEIEGSIIFSNHRCCLGNLPTLYAYYLNAIED